MQAVNFSGGVALGQLTEMIKGLDWSVLVNMLISIIPALICITFHELSHGFVAYKLGDNTAKNAGRLTLNPIKHIDIPGLIMMIAFRFGWAKPVPVNMDNFKNPKKGMAITALAGPLSNIILAIVFLFCYGLFYASLAKLGTTGRVIAELLYVTANISVYLAVFNIIPIPPLDGSKVLFSILPNRYYYKLMRYERYGMLILMLFIIVTRRVGSPLLTVTDAIFGALFNVAKWGFDIAVKMM